METIQRGGNTWCLQRAAQAWCSPVTEKIEMDARLASEFATILFEEMNKPNLGGATTAEIIDELRARIELDGKLEYRTVDIDTD